MGSYGLGWIGLNEHDETRLRLCQEISRFRGSSQSPLGTAFILNCSHSLSAMLSHSLFILDTRRDVHEIRDAYVRLFVGAPLFDSHVAFQPLEIFVDDETKSTLHGLQQHFVKLDEVGKNRRADRAA